MATKDSVSPDRYYGPADALVLRMELQFNAGGVVDLNGDEEMKVGKAYRWEPVVRRARLQRGRSGMATKDSVSPDRYYGPADALVLRMELQFNAGGVVDLNGDEEMKVGKAYRWEPVYDDRASSCTRPARKPIIQSINRGVKK